MDDNTGLRPIGPRPDPAEEVTSSSIGPRPALPEGWVMLGRCRFGIGTSAAYPTGCWALAHPTTGVALVDLGPGLTANAEPRLRRALNAADFWSSFPGYLPVWQGLVALSDWRALPEILVEGFSELPPLTVPGRMAWIAAARVALAEDPAWEVPGAPQRAMPALEEDAFDEEDVRPPRRQGRRGLGIGLGLATILAVGFAVMLPSADGPSPDRAAPRPAEVPAAPLHEVASLTPRAVGMPAANAALAPEREVLRPAVLLPEPPAVAQRAPDPPAQAGDPMTDIEQPPQAPVPAAGMEGVASGMAAPELPLPPRAPRPPVQKTAARASERIDRACALAQLRFQQGHAITATEAAYLRSGCATKR